jgi:L-amino acid N-acyltransferase YncA
VAVVTGRLRLARGEDAAAVAAIYAPIVRDTPISFETEPPGAAVMRQRIEATLPVHPWLVLEAENRLLGYAYASQHRSRAAYRWAVDMSAYVDAGCRRQGAARRLYGALLAILELQRFATACAGITLPNPASVGLHEAIGMAPVGVYRRIGFKLGRWHDVGWWQRALGDPRSGPPAEPMALATLLEDGAGRAQLESLLQRA